MSSRITELLLRAGAFLLLAALILWPLEQLFPKRRRTRPASHAWVVDLGWLVLGAATLKFVVGPAMEWFFGTPLHSRSGWRLGLAFLGAEVMAYGIHRAMHEVPVLWQFHAVHHAPRELSWTHAWRQHPVDVALHAFAVGLPGWILGAPLSGLAGLVLVRRLYTGLLHANVDLDYGPLEGVLASPKFHQLHHRHERRYFDSNYAGLFPWLDVLFGTRTREARAVLPARAARERSGLASDSSAS